MADGDDEDENDDGPSELAPDELARRLDAHPVVLAGVRVVGVDLSGRNLQEAHFEDADLVDCRFVGADLYAANLCRVGAAGLDFARATLAKTMMIGADLRGARLDGANLIRAHLSSAHLSGASLRGADLRGAFLDGADLTGADLTGATGLDTANGLATAVGLAPAIAPAPPATFPRYPGARTLHSQSVSLGPRGGFVWTAYATTDPVAAVVAHYERTLGLTATARDTPAPSWDLTLAGEVLSIYGAADHRSPHGGDGPTAAETTVLRFSTRPPRDEPARNPFAGPFPAPVPVPSPVTPAPSGPRVVYRTVDGEARTVALDGDEMYIGRRDAAIDTSTDAMTARRHAVLRRGDDGRWSVEDLLSANGVYVNGEKVRAWVLDSGDRILCGRTELRFIDD